MEREIRPYLIKNKTQTAASYGSPLPPPGDKHCQLSHFYELDVSYMLSGDFVSYMLPGGRIRTLTRQFLNRTLQEIFYLQVSF